MFIEGGVAGGFNSFVFVSDCCLPPPHFAPTSTTGGGKNLCFSLGGAALYILSLTSSRVTPGCNFWQLVHLELKWIFFLVRAMY